MLPLVTIEPFLVEHIGGVKELTDREIGHNYYSLEDLKLAQEKSIFKSVNVSFVLLDQDKKVQGLRLTYPQGAWTSGKGEGLSTQSWPHSISQTAYFQSLFISEPFQGKGWGQKMSQRSLRELRKIMTQGVVCHSWKESPHNSSQKYLLALGFQFIAEYPLFWKEVDYICPRCGAGCECTAQEMYLNL